MTAGADAVDATEMVVLLTDDGRPSGTAPKSCVHHADTPLHLGFSCYLFDADGAFVLTRRASDKATFPGVLTNSFCGHPAPGESLVDAVRRRAAVELGVAGPDIVGVRLVLADFAYRAEMDAVVENELCPVLVAHLRTDAGVDPDPCEVGLLEHVDWAGFVDDVTSGRLRVSPWCAEQVAALRALGDCPDTWPDADPARLPSAVKLDHGVDRASAERPSGPSPVTTRGRP